MGKNWERFLQPMQSHTNLSLGAKGKKKNRRSYNLFPSFSLLPVDRSVGRVGENPGNKVEKLRRNLLGNLLGILIFSGQKPCTRIIETISPSFSHFSRVIDITSYL